jgi:hypothetical protein
MSGEYDTDKRTFMTTGVRITLVTVVTLVAVIVLGYSMCTGYIIRGSILWPIVLICAIVLAYAIFGDRKSQYRVTPRPTDYVSEPQLVSTQRSRTSSSLSAYPSGEVNGESLMSYKGRPYNWVHYDPTGPDPV